MDNKIGSSALPEHGERYSTVAVALHWIIAAVIVLQLFLGWRMSDLDGASRSFILQIHKSIGITILILSVVRLVWRLRNSPPAPDASLSRVERVLSTWVHRGFYVVMLGLPLTGWAMISTTRGGAMTRLFGLIPWPPLPFLNRLPAGPRDAVSGVFESAHGALVWIAVALFALHVAGALKHHFISRDRVLGRMATWVRQPRLFAPRFLVIPVVGILAGALAYVPPLPPAAAPRPKPIELAQADIYLDVVAPALSRRCASCHNDDRTRGGLSLQDHAAVMEGGLHGDTVVPGNPEQSELLRRVTLANSHEEFMPKGGRTPLTPEQVTAIHWWIVQGAPRSAAVGSLELTSAARSALANILGFASGEVRVASADDENGDLPRVEAADPKAIAALEASGFVVRPVAKGETLLDINYAILQPLSEDQIQMLGAVAPQVLRLSLRQADVTNAGLKTIARMTNLRRLRLESNPIDDAGVAELQGLKELRYLNLTGTRITDRGLVSLGSLPKLRRIYLWNTSITPNAAEALRRSRPELLVNVGAQLKLLPPPASPGGPPRAH